MLSWVHSVIAILLFIMYHNYLEHLGKMQIEVPQTKSFSFVILEAGPEDFNSPMSLWIIFFGSHGLTQDPTTIIDD